MGYDSGVVEVTFYAKTSNRSIYGNVFNPMKLSPEILLLLFCLFIAGTPAGAQDYFSGKLAGPESHATFFAQLDSLHQEFRRQESKVLLESGYHSPEHRALLEQIRSQDSLLLLSMDKYLDVYGFPQYSPSDNHQAIELSQELARQLEHISPTDTIARDSVFGLMKRKFQQLQRPPSFVRTTMLVLNTQPDFAKRCAIIPLLRFEWEAGNLSTSALHTYLLGTYLGWQGRELPIANGTTEHERVLMYARELSGCWGNH